jgi:hypothetical protein
MAINKNFVVRNGFEVSTNLILANADTRKVGIGTTIPERELQVAGGIGATNFYLTGIGTFVDELNVGLGGTVLTVLGLGNSIGVGTSLPEYLLDIRSPVSTGQTALYVQGDVEITGDIEADDVVFDDALIQDLRVTDTLFVVGVSTFTSNVFINTELNVSGITTLGSYVDINNSVDISNDLNVVGLSTLGGYVDINNSVDIGVDLNVVGLSTLGGYVDINNSVDISNDLNVVGITTLATADINAGEIDVTRIETEFLSVTGIATIATISVVGAALSSLTVSGISTLSTVDINGGDIEVSNVDTTDLNVSGIATLGTIEINSGIITATSGIVTYYGDGSNLSGLPGASSLETVLGIGNTSTIGMSIVGVVTATSFVGDGSGLTGVGITGSINTAGIITASAFFGDGSGLTGAGSTVFDDTTTNQEFFPLFTDITTGTVTSSGISTSKLTYNPSTGTLTSTAFVGDGSGLTGAGSTVFNDTTTNQEFFPLFTGITTGTVTSSGISTSKLTYNPSTGVLTVIDLNSTSDINLKENIHTVENPLETINSLRGVSFDWKENGRSSYGVIAQELEEVIPELVKTGEVKSVNYNGLIGILIEGMKSQQEQINRLEQKIQELTNR